jgi:hypothetical protein
VRRSIGFNSSVYARTLTLQTSFPVSEQQSARERLSSSLDERQEPSLNPALHCEATLNCEEVTESCRGILACVAVGILLAGCTAERITGRNHGLLMILIVGIIGAFIGGFLVSSLLGFR